MAKNRPSSVETVSPRHMSFGEYRFDPGSGELWRGGEECRLTPRAASLLAVLAVRATRLVTKQELIARVWGGKAVGDDALTSCVRELRRFLVDDAHHPRVLETCHRRGYRLLMPVTREAEVSTMESAPPLAAPDKPSLAVLPFANLSPDQGQDCLADGIVEDLQAYDCLLRALPGFQSLVDPEHKEAIALFHKALELEPAYALAMALAAWGHAQCFSRQMADNPASDRRSVDLVSAALALAPDDRGVLIAAGQALLLANSFQEGDGCAFLFRKALAIDPNSAPAWRRMGYVHILRSEPVEAVEAFERALRPRPLDPMSSYARSGIADAHFMEGRLMEALRLYRRCASERPHDLVFQRRICAILALAGESGKAKRMARDLKAKNPSITLENLASAFPHSPYLRGLRLAGFR